jgi:xanthine dehydrogenase YagR molybdenum-binding subunit
MSQPLVGAPRDRVEGPAKVSGIAIYTGDYSVEGLLHAVVVPSTIAKGSITAIDDALARGSPGVVAVMTHDNAPRVNARKNSASASNGFLLQDEVVEFDRQPVAVVIAESFEAAVCGADLVRVQYRAQAPEMSLDTAPRYVPGEIFGRPAAERRGDPATAFAKAAVRVADRAS